MEVKSIATEDTTIDRTCTRCGKPFSVFRSAGDVIHPNCLPQKCDDCKTGKSATVVRACKWCGKDFEQQRRSTIGRLDSYCSDDCRRQKSNQRSKVLAKRKTPDVPCKLCGTILEHNGRTICRQCKTILKTEGITVPCDTCGKDFTAHSLTAKACRECRLWADKKRRQDMARERAVARLTVGASHHVSNNVGAIGEKLFDILCLREDVSAAIPTRDNQANWDRLVVCGRNAYRVQVKSFSGYRFDDYVKWRNQETVILPSVVDFVAVVDVSSADIWLLDAEAAAANRSFKRSQTKCCNAIVSSSVSLKELLQSDTSVRQ